MCPLLTRRSSSNSLACITYSLLEYYLDRHVLNLLALKKAQELVASQNLIFSVESWDTILKDPKKTIALKPVSGTALIGKRGAEKVSKIRCCEYYFHGY